MHATLFECILKFIKEAFFVLFCSINKTTKNHIKSNEWGGRKRGLFL